jgi:hypothetical protein
MRWSASWVSSFSLFSLLSLRMAGSARAADAVLSGDVRQIVASGSRVAVVQGRALLWLNDSGQPIGRLGHERGGDFARQRRRRALDADEIVALGGVPDDDLESDRVEELLDDEGVRPAGGHRQGHARGDGEAPDPAATAPRALVAGRDAIWIATGAGLWRIDTGDTGAGDGARPVAVGPRHLPLDAIAVAEPGRGAGPDAGPILAAISGDKLLRSGDGGASWRVLAVLDSPARAVEISRDGGDVFVLDDGGVAAIAHHTRTPLFNGRAHHMALCGEDLLILSDDGVHSWRWDRGLETRSGRLPARRLACAASVPGRVVAVGAGLWSSPDGGHTWARRDDLAMLDVQSAAIAPGRIWIGTAEGLWQAPIEPPATPAPTAPVTVPAAPGAAATVAAATAIARRAATLDVTAEETLRRLSRTRRAFWHDLLPRVAVVVETDTVRPGTSRGALWVLLTFPLERPHPPAFSAVALARDLARRRSSAAGELARLTASRAGADQVAAEARALLDSLEDLR